VTDQAQALSLSMLGLVGSGKTTYLVALWAIVKNADEDAPLALRGPLPDATGYLDQGAHRLLAGEAVRRTNYDTGEDVRLELTLDSWPLVLNQLDVSGETIQEAIVARELPRVVHERVARSDGVLLFVHPDKVARPFTIPETHVLSEAAGQTPEDEDEDEPLVPPDDNLVRRSAPTAVQLVDLLQVAAGAAERRLPVAVVVSAWDEVEADDPHARPRAWLSSSMPLLAQFLDNNADHLPNEVFGVSAQGGDYEAPGVAEALAQRAVSERVRTASPDGPGNDLAVPLRWLLQSRL